MTDAGATWLRPGMWQEYLSNKVRRQEYLTKKVNLVQSAVFFADYDYHSLTLLIVIKR